MNIPEFVRISDSVSPNIYSIDIKSDHALSYPLVVAAMATVDMEIRVHCYAKPDRKLRCRSLNSPLSCPRIFPL